MARGLMDGWSADAFEDAIAACFDHHCLEEIPLLMAELDRQHPARASTIRHMFDHA